MPLLNNFSFIMFLFCISFSFTYEEHRCKYKEQVDDEYKYTDYKYFSGIGLDEINKRKQKCYDLSYSEIFNKPCCYNLNTTNCTEQTKGENGEIVSCPIETNVPNNCGTAGIYQPETSEACTGISLVGGYCCYVSFNGGSKSCIKTNKLNDNINTETEMIKNYVNKYNKENPKALSINEVICGGFNLKIVSRIIVISFLLLL